MVRSWLARPSLFLLMVIMGEGRGRTIYHEVEGFPVNRFCFILNRLVFGGMKNMGGTASGGSASEGGLSWSNHHDRRQIPL